MAKKNISNYSLQQIKQEFFNEPGKSYNYNGQHFKNANEMYSWIQKQKQDYKSRGEQVRITFDPDASKSYSKTTTRTVKQKVQKQQPTSQTQTAGTKTNPPAEPKKEERLQATYAGPRPLYEYTPGMIRQQEAGIMESQRRAYEDIDAKKKAGIATPYYDAMHSGMNDAANLAALLLTGPMGGNMLRTGYGMLRAGQYLPLIGGAVGSYLGTKAGDEATSYLTNGQYDTTYDMLRSSGMWGYNAAMTNPFTLGGGYIGSQAANLMGQAPEIAVNARSWARNAIPRTAYTEEGVPIEQYGGDRVILESQPTGYTGNTYAGSRYTGHYTNPKGATGSGGRPRHAGHTASSGGKGSGRGKSTGVSSTPVSEVSSVAGGNKQLIETPFEPYLPINGGPTIAVPVPTTGTVPTPTPDPEPTPETRIEKIDTIKDPWETWYSQQDEGSTVYWPGPENGEGSAHERGWYKIHRVNADIPTERRRVATGFDDSRGENKVVPDSTSFRLAPVTRSSDGSYRVLRGGVDPNAEVSEEYLITPQQLEEARKRYLGRKHGGLIPRKLYI